VVHQRFSTNTFPSWPLAHPFRYISHNGEINTLRGNINWMKAREHSSSPRFMAKTSRICCRCSTKPAAIPPFRQCHRDAGDVRPFASARHDDGIPEAWDGTKPCRTRRKHSTNITRASWSRGTVRHRWFHRRHSIGAVLDRNGLRPSRYYILKDGSVVMASEVGVLDVPPSEIVLKGRLQPEKMFLIDTRRDASSTTARSRTRSRPHIRTGSGSTKT
jgi:glutamate synthase domain-containing protein 1